MRNEIESITDQKLKARLNAHTKEEADRWKEFFGRFEKIVNAYGGKGTFELIPKHELTKFFIIRNQSIRIIKSKDFSFPDKLLKSINRYFSKQTRTYNLPDLSGSIPMSIRDFSNVWMTLYFMLEIIKRDQCQWGIEFTKRLRPYVNDEIYDSQFEKVNFFLDLFAYEFSRLPFDALSCSSSIKMHDTSVNIAWEVSFRSKKNEPRQIQYQNEMRTAYPVCISRRNMISHIECKLKDIGKVGIFGELKVELYVLEHAINRLYERLNCLNEVHVRRYYGISLRFPVFHYESDDRVLIEYRFCSIKLGYFVAQYIEGVLLIRTFLFLTNNGTPEGRRLNELTGLSKVDKKYLQIDQLKAFFDSDIEENEHLKQLFTEAGCSCLFDVKKAFDISGRPVAKVASFIDHYLSTGEFVDDLGADDDD